MTPPEAEREAAVDAARQGLWDAINDELRFHEIVVTTDEGVMIRARVGKAEMDLTAAARAAGRGEAEGALRGLMTVACSQCGWDFIELSHAELARWRQYHEGCACAKARALLSEPEPPETTS